MMNLKTKSFILLSFFVITFLAIFTRGPLAQRLDYHQFADQAVFFHIPHVGDVCTNFIFILVGGLGAWLVRKNQAAIVGHRSWMVFFLSIFLIGPGSAYYHWNPNNSTLVWDRLPMGVGFMALYIVLMIEHMNPRWEKWLGLACFIGVASVVVWALYDDLRFYFWVQFSSFLTIPIILLLFKSTEPFRGGYYWCFLFYLLAKITEHFDRKIYELSGEIISGHNLKHLLAGIGIAFLIRMIKLRLGAKSTLLQS
jgi:hypothetical protein